MGRERIAEECLGGREWIADNLGLKAASERLMEDYQRAFER